MKRLKPICNSCLACLLKQDGVRIIFALVYKNFCVEKNKGLCRNFVLVIVPLFLFIVPSILGLVEFFLAMFNVSAMYEFRQSPMDLMDDDVGYYDFGDGRLACDLEFGYLYNPSWVWNETGGNWYDSGDDRYLNNYLEEFYLYEYSVDVENEEEEKKARDFITNIHKYWISYYPNDEYWWSQSCTENPKYFETDAPKIHEYSLSELMKVSSGFVVKSFGNSSCEFEALELNTRMLLKLQTNGYLAGNVELVRAELTSSEVVDDMERVEHSFSSNLLFHFLGKEIISNISAGYNMSVIQAGVSTSISFFVDKTALDFFSNLTIILLFPLGLSFFLPLFSEKLIREKKKEIVEFLQLFGVGVFHNEVSRFLSDYVFYFLQVCVSVIVPLVFLVEFFVQGNLFYTILLFLLWGFVLLSLSYVLSIFISNPSVVSYFGYVMLILSFLIGALLQTIISSDEVFSWYMIYPPFAFQRGISILLASMSDLVATSPHWYQIWVIFGIMIVQFLVLYSFFILCQCGVFVKLKSVFNRLLRKLVKVAFRENDPGFPYKIIRNVVDNLKMTKDENGFESNVILEVKGVSKEFDFPVLRNVDLNIHKGSCHGLLGPNGSGKTTLVRCICSLLDVNSGSVIFYDEGKKVDCLKQKGSMRKVISVCPQFNSLIDDLTVTEQMIFFSLLRDIAVQEIKSNMNALMEELELMPFDDKLTKNLSGGYRKRLSIAVSLIGDPKLIICDEISSGLDPGAKVGVWKILEKIKQDRSVLLITHSMLEASKLCERLTILEKGIVKCAGETFALKQKFSKGYQLLVSLVSHEYRETANDFISLMLGEDNIITREFYDNSVLFRINEENIKFSNVFKSFNEKEMKIHGIDTFSISESPLEEVYTHFIETKERRKRNEYMIDLLFKEELDDLDVLLQPESEPILFEENFVPSDTFVSLDKKDLVNEKERLGKEIETLKTTTEEMNHELRALLVTFQGRKEEIEKVVQQKELIEKTIEDVQNKMALKKYYIDQQKAEAEMKSTRLKRVIKQLLLGIQNERSSNESDLVEEQSLATNEEDFREEVIEIVEKRL